MSKYLYFFVYYHRNKEENTSNIYFTKPEKKNEKPENYYSQSIDIKNKKFNYINIFRAKSDGIKKYYFHFVIGDDKYEITFDNQNSKFIYDITLYYGLKIIKVRRRINQNLIEYKDKMNFFIKAINENEKDEEQKNKIIDELLGDTVELYLKKKGFHFLIPLFLQVYEKKELCNKLMKYFKDTDEKSKINNIEKKKYLEHFSSTINEILLKAEKIIAKYNYNPVDFYGVILCYLNHYDEENFSRIVNELSLPEKSPNVLYDIMLSYQPHFKNQINLNLNFYNNFISYTIKNKDYTNFQIGLTYIKDMETFINVIEDNSEDIYEKFNNIINEKNMIKIDKNLIFNKIKNSKDESNSSEKNADNIPLFIKHIEEILNLEREKNKVFINFTNDFWNKILNSYNEANLNNIYICAELRKIFIKYYELVENNIKENQSIIKKDAKYYYKNDEFAFLLDKIINNFIKTIDKERSTIEKLSLIKDFNPYYGNKEYSKKVDPKIFDYVDLDEIDDDFILDFKNLDFEHIFQDKLNDYIQVITSKIKKTRDFEIVIKLINIDNLLEIKNKEKIIFTYLDSLKKKYEIITKEIDENIKTLKNKNLEEAIKKISELEKSKENKLTETDSNLKETVNKLKMAIKIIVDLSLLDYKYENQKEKFDFIDNINKNLPKNILSFIFIEIIRKCIIEQEEKLKNNKDDEDIVKEEVSNEEEDHNEEVENNDIDIFFMMREYIFDKFINGLKNNNDINNIIKLIDCIQGKTNEENDKEKNESEQNEIDIDLRNQILNEFYKKLMEKNLFKKDELYENKPNIKIKLIYELNERGKINKKAEYYEGIKNLIDNICSDIIDYNITKNKLEEFLTNDKSIIIERLSLIKLKYDSLVPEELYEQLKNKMIEINKKIKILKTTKDNIILYYKDTYKDEIKKLINIINDTENKKIKDYDKNEDDDENENLYKLIERCDGKELKSKVTEIENVKDFLLFNVIYEMNKGGNEKSNFKKAKEEFEEIIKLINLNDISKLYDGKSKNSEIIDNIISKLKNNDKENIEFMEKLKKYIIKDDKLYENLTILFKIEKYKYDLNSMIFFFECIGKDNKDNEKSENKKWINNLKAYKDLSIIKFKETKKKLEELDNSNIYNYKQEGEYNKLFTCLYDKKEAIDFLIDKLNDNLDNLKDKIDPTNTTIKYENISDTKDCIEFLKEMKKKYSTYDKMLIYIKSHLKESKIKKFVKYSKNYSQIIDLDRYYNPKENIFEEVKSIIENLTLNIFQDKEQFFYILKNENDKTEKKDITMEELIKLKNKIPPESETNEENIDSESNNVGNSMEKKVSEMKSKTKILLFFKNLVTNLEKINEYMEVLRTKGSSLPIKICIQVTLISPDEINKNNDLNKYCIKYFLEGKEYNLNFIENEFLSPAKNSYISQINSKYKGNPNLRLIYGQQFRSMMKHLEEGLNIDSFLRYIINNTDNNKPILEGEKGIIRNVQDYVSQYKEFNEGSLKSISLYITNLFKSNGDKTIEDHYESMKINSDNVYKGIYLYCCKKNKSMEEIIINLFMDKIGELPIAQNVLITNKETSDEEMQAFFHRAILCNFNTLFVVEINDSISKYQQSIMNSYISQILDYKNKKKNEKLKKIGRNEIKKKNLKEYMDSCIVFIYEEENNQITSSFLNEIKKLDTQNLDNDINLNDISESENNYKSEIHNIKVISSDICGLGKSGKIRKLINDDNKKYYHFTLGGILTKEIIFKKLEQLLENIKNEDYKQVAIHLDLTESEEKSILNEFFFSFLITKFYSNNENILYIPKDIDIYVEIPNCFVNYLDKFSILKLNLFEKINITFDDMPSFNFPDSIINIFNNMLGINSNEEIREFVKKYIGIEGRFSYHQINIFIKLFISQYSQFEGKLKFTHNIVDKKGKLLDSIDETEIYIKEFAKSTIYFTNGGFSKLLTGYTENKDIDYIDLLSEQYENDLNKMKFISPLVFLDKENMEYHKLIIENENLEKYNKSEDYLLEIKKILNLPNDVKKDVKKGDITYKSLLSIIEEKNNRYVITSDNFKKMVLLVYRIKANVPVIIMGDTGCGKTALITKLNQILNNGETTVKIKNIHPGINDKKLTEIMDEIEETAKDKSNKELWLFFDEINTCPSLSLITEIFINRTYNGKLISENIRLIGACNPYRKRKGNKEKCGLSFSDDNDNELVYIVNPLPQSLLYYVFSFGRINDEDEKKYIFNIIECLFPKEEKQKIEQQIIEKNKIKNSKDISKDKKEKIDRDIKTLSRELKFHQITTDAISECHKYLRKAFDDSIVSLREISRFPKLVEFFKKYFTLKNIYLNRKYNNEKNNLIRSIICSIYLCYYIRLTDDMIRSKFEQALRSTLLRFVTDEEKKSGNLIDQIQNEELSIEIGMFIKQEIIDKNFSDFLKIEQDFLIQQIQPDDGIGRNTLLKENAFLLFVSILTNIPLIIIGKPGTGKSLSVQLLNKSLKGEYSNKKYFKLYPKMIQTYFQGSLSTTTDDVENLFIKLGDKLKFYNKLKEKNPKIILPISTACFDELGLAERSKNKPLKALHPELDYTGKKINQSFVGISNYSLDAAKLNRALVLSVPDLDKKIDELIQTAKQIVESVAPKIKEEKIFDILSNTYCEYKKQLQFIKELVVYKQYYKNYLLGKENTIKKKETIIKDKEKIEKKEESKESDKEKEIKEHEMGSYTSKNSKKQDGKDDAKKFLIGTFESIKDKKEYRELMKKDEKIRKDFHGNRDFYNLIKGIAKALRKPGEFSDYHKVQIIMNYIERNFGGIEYEIDIDVNLILEDMEEDFKITEKILEGTEFDKNKSIKINSVVLFKKLYNLECDKIAEDSNSDDLKNNLKNLKIKEDDINKYNLNRCINDNINDINSRYLLLEINQSLTPLIVQNIRLENEQFKKIKLIDGSPFHDDDNNEYRFKKISEIREVAKEDKLIIIENLDRMHPFLFDLYNMNYEIIDDEKYARICLDSFRELKTLVNDKFRIIILVDENYVNKCDLAFLNRLEKMNLSFDKLLDDDLKKLSDNIIDDIELNSSIDYYKNKANYALEDLLINSKDQEIRGLIYYYSKINKKKSNDYGNNKEKINEENLSKIVIDKIYKILPQDIISILGKNNKIRKKYYDEQNGKKIYNLNDYINYMESEESQNFKISIIYTFTSIASNVDIEGLENKMSIMFEQIHSENQFKNIIDEIKKNNDSQKKYINIHFEQSNSKNIKFISNFIINNFKDDNYKYIIIIHINRNFNKNKYNNKQNVNNYEKQNKNKETIYSFPDINPDINQIFIDNLNGNKDIKLGDLLENNNISDILFKLKGDLKLDEEFNKALINFLNEELDKNSFDDKSKKDYIKEIKSYLKNENEIKDKMIEIAYNFNNNFNKDDNSSSIIEDMLMKKVNKFSVDMVSCIIDYIKEEVFIKNLNNIFKILEDNNILTTIIETQKRNYESISKNTVKEIIVHYLTIKPEDKKYTCKFLYNYNIPGFYNFYRELSNIINQKISSGYFNNEKIIRELLKPDQDKINDFHKKEKTFINIVYSQILEKDNFILEIMDKIKDDIFLKDYITYYLQKYTNKIFYKIDDIYHKVIEFLLKLRFNNDDNTIESQLLKIIWIESNVNYILNIVKIIEDSIIIFRIFGYEEDQLYEEIEKLYNKHTINYITNEEKNPKITTEVNQCYYILLAIICYCITSEDIKLEVINQYYNKLIDINKILQNLNIDLYIYLNEMYIIDELIKIIEIFKKKNNIKKINDIKDLLRENAEFIQNYYKSDDLSENLKDNFEKIYKEIISDKDKYKGDVDYFNNLRYILFKEIKKINDIDYRYKILELLLEHNEMIKKSNDIFQIVLKNYLNKNNFKNNIDSITNNINKDDDIINLIDVNLNENYVLEETILYLFEKNSLNYYNYILNNKKKINNLEDEPLKILKDCIQFLENIINEPNKVNSKGKIFCKIFCLAYIKTYCHIMFKNDKPKVKDPKTIIKVLNGNNSIYKMIRLYIYKILYNNYSLDFLKDSKNIKKYGVKELKDFEQFIEAKELSNNIYIIDYKVRTLKEKDESFNKDFIKYEKEKFNKKIAPTDYNVKGEGIDNFYVASYNLILANLLANNKEINNNFFDKICTPLFKEKEIIFKAIDLIYNPKKFGEISKKYNINPNNIKPLLYGYRYCLSILSISESKKTIYYPFYEKNKIKCFKEKYYPGNDTKHNELFSNVINHFKIKKDQGCYVCLCSNPYYHSIPSGYPSKNDLNKTCPKCKQNIGWISSKKNEDWKIVKRNDYYRIFKDKNDLEKFKKNNKFVDINCMTLKEFQKEYMYKSFKSEIGIYVGTKDSFKNNNKIVRNLSQISYRLLNFILYSNLFFARIIAEKSEIDKYLPKNMSWNEILYQIWNSLNNELLNVNIDSIEKFMNYIFVNIFPLLINIEAIDKYDTLVEIEDKLEKEIQNCIKNYEQYYKNLNEEGDNNSFINLITEKFNHDKYKNNLNEKDKKDEFPFYKFFYYTNYLDEGYIKQKISNMDENKYPVLKMYLDQYKNNDKKDKNKYLIDNIYLFNNVLNILSQKYINNISSDEASKIMLKETKIYNEKIENEENEENIFDKFIAFYNKLDIKNKKNENSLTNENYLCDFFIRDDNDFGINYKTIYKAFITNQNDQIHNLLEKKGIYDNNNKNIINVQQINKDDIFDLNLPKSYSFIDIIFNSSYRKIIDLYPNGYNSYKEYVIFYDLIEEIMADLLLNNKKLLNDTIEEFVYNNESFNNEVTNLFTIFKKTYEPQALLPDNKFHIYRFCKDNNNNEIHKKLIRDFLILTKYVNENKKEDLDNRDNIIKNETKIYEIIDKLNDTSEYISELFEKNESLTVNKTFDIFDYYLKVIYSSIISDLNDYTEELDNKFKEKIDNFFKKAGIIRREDLAYALRLFITIVLFREEDKDKKIKSNHNNTINYLKANDLWNINIDKNEKFQRDFNELKKINIPINQIISFYEIVGKDIKDNFFDDVDKKMKEAEEKEEETIQENNDNNIQIDNNNSDNDEIEEDENEPRD